jgi:hypothetical protein
MFENDKMEHKYKESLIAGLKKEHQQTEHSDAVVAEEELSIKIKEIENMDLNALHECFMIEPVRGVIWPQSTVDFSAIFAPTVSGLYDHLFYCNVSGKDVRLALNFKGEAIGPKIKLSTQSWDMGEVFLGTYQTCKVWQSNFHNE